MTSDFKISDYPCFDWWQSGAGKKEATREELAKLQRNTQKAHKEAEGYPSALSIVEGRQKALDERIAAAQVNVLGSTSAIKSTTIHHSHRT